MLSIMSDLPVHDENDNALLAAVENQDLKRLEFLVKSGCNLYVHDNIGNTALHKAVLLGELAIVKVNFSLVWFLVIIMFYGQILDFYF